MNWLNLETRILHAPEYIGSDPRQRGTWTNVCLWCAQQENGGRIVGASNWKDRQWQQTCGVTCREVQSASLLLVWSGEDLIVWGYPIEQETLVRTKREIAKVNGRLGGRPITKEFDNKPTSVPTLVSTPEPASESVKERKGKEGNSKGKESNVGKNESADSPTLNDSDWFDGLGKSDAYAGIDIRREHAKMVIWCQGHQKQPTRRRFINWLNRADKPLVMQSTLEEQFNKF